MRTDFKPFGGPLDRSRIARMLSTPYQGQRPLMNGVLEYTVHLCVMHDGKFQVCTLDEGGWRVHNDDPFEDARECIDFYNQFLIDNNCWRN